MGTTKDYQQKMEYIEAYLNAAWKAGKREVIKDVFIADCAYHFKTGDITIWRILKILNKLGKIEITGNMIYRGKK